MPTTTKAYICSPSTHRAALDAKMARPPEARPEDRPKGVRRGWFGLPEWPWRKPLTIKLAYRGGAEAWVEIHSRGRTVRRPGHVHLVDIFAEIAQRR